MQVSRTYHVGNPALSDQDVVCSGAHPTGMRPLQAPASLPVESHYIQVLLFSTFSTFACYKTFK